MEPSFALLLGVVSILALGVLLFVWNFFARRYNDRLLANSFCRTSGLVLGTACIPLARAKWREELKLLREKGESGIKLSNLEIRCPHCGGVNMERDLFAAKRQQRK